MKKEITPPASCSSSRSPSWDGTQDKHLRVDRSGPRIHFDVHVRAVAWARGVGGDASLFSKRFKWLVYSLPEFLDFFWEGKSFLVVDEQFGHVFANPLRKGV